MRTALERARRMVFSVLREASPHLVLSASLAMGTPVVAQEEVRPEEPTQAPAEPGPVAPLEPPAETPTVPPAEAPTEAPAETPPAEEPAPEAPAESSRFDVTTPAESRISQAASAILGRVVDVSTGEPIIEAEVFVQQGDVRLQTYTDVDGNFAIEVPPGLWVVSAHADFYSNARHRPLRVRIGQRVRAVLRLREANDDHLVFEVTEVADRRSEAVLNQDRMNATTAQDTIGGAQMARTGSTNAARAAARVVGASLDNGTLIVRGLGDRYTNVLMNGVFLPGMDPDRNGVQIDVIPAAVIANISIIKTFQPSLPATWAGGLAVIESQAMPERFEFRASGSLGMNTTSSFRNVNTYPGSPGDAFGFGLGSRRLPAAVPDYLVFAGRTRPDGSTITADDDAAVGRSFSRTWDYYSRRQGPIGTFQLSLGNTHRLRHGRRFGYLAGVNYNRYTQVRRSVNNLVGYVDPTNPRAVTLDATYLGSASIEDVLLTGFATASLRYSDTGDIRVLAMYTQSTTDETRVQSGYERDGDEDVQRWQLQYVRRGVLFTQAIGEQRGIPWFTDERARLRYSAYFASSDREEPNTRQVRYTREAGTGDPFTLNDSPNGSDILSLSLSQRDYGGYAHLHLPLFGESSAEVGVDTRMSQRSSEFRQFHFRTFPGSDPTLFTEPANDIFAPENITGSRPIRLDERTQAQNNYAGSSRWIAAFVSTDFRLASWARLVGGARMETLSREVHLFDPIFGIPQPSDSTPTRVQRNALDFLPAASLIVTPRESMNVRLAYGMTVMHPQFREFAPSIYFDFARRRNISGNPDLLRTHVHNVDLRWELAHGSSGLFAVSGFYKHFVHPIERINASASSRDLKYANADGGNLMGVELEGRFNLGQFDETASWMDWFTLNANLSFIYSRVQLSEESASAQPERNRPLFMQSPYVANLSLGFDHPDSGVSLNLAYNVVGPRIVEVGFLQVGAATPNVVERQFHQVDLVGGYALNDHVRFTLTCRNIARQYRTLKQGYSIVERYDPGTDVYVGVSLTN